MNYLLALAPDLGVDPTAFAASWNDHIPTQALGPARVVAQGTTHYDPSLGAALIELTLALTSGIVGQALYDLIKERLAAQGVRRSVTIIERTTPSGERLLIIHAEEE